MMWFLLLLLHAAHIELVISEAEGKLILNNTGDNPCEGHVKVYHKNIWGYVGDAYWNENTEKVVCKSAHCGEPLPISTENVIELNGNSAIWLNELKCQGTESALWECDGPGWNASVYQKFTVKKLSCSSKITISLDGSKCAGAVKYNDGKTSGYFCNTGWGNKTASLVCKSLGCGGVREIPPSQWMDSEAFQSSKTKMTLDCSAFQNGDPNNLWQCVTGKHSGNPDTCKPASVICEGHQRLQLKGNRSNVCSGQLEEERNGVWEPVRQNNLPSDVCQQMHCGTPFNVNTTNNVTCADKVRVVLMDAGRESNCYGTVHIEVNSSAQPVCASSWNEVQAELVCRELNCGTLINFSKAPASFKGVMDHVECNGSESSLWHCQAHRAKSIQCSSRAKVVCSGGVKMELVDGPGKCAGRLAIMFEGKWRRVTNTLWTDAHSAAVCKQLGCGNNGKTEKFSQGSDDFLSADCENKQISNIYKCLKTDTNRQSQGKQAIGITCEDHKVVFLNGTEACSGHVGIKHGSNTYWLSGSNVTWDQKAADIVCHQMHCGTASTFTYNDMTVHEAGRVWNESLSCLFKNNSLFDCNKTPPPPDHHNSTAYVNCSGNIVMNLTNGCCGKVKVYMEEVQGDMCADTWTEEKSRLLCANLGCGMALKAHHSQTDGDVRFNSLDATLGPNAALTQWNFVRTRENDKSCNKRPAYVVCSGSVRPRLREYREHCSGNVEVAYEGQWIPVCSGALNDTNTRNTICRELECGDAVALLPHFGPPPAAKLAISNVKCSADAKSSLSACDIATSQSACKYAGLRCADWKAMVPVGDKACSGTVLVHTGKGKSSVSSQGWNIPEKERLCKDMNCSQFSLDTTQVQGTVIDSFWSKSFSCANITPTNIWECEKETPPSEKNALLIKCEGEPSVNLSEGCSGVVSIDTTPVCAHNWSLASAHMVCQEKRCGNAIDVTMTQSQPSTDTTYHVSCDKYHTVLGQCRRIPGECAEGVVSISCSENVKFRTTQQNGGKLEVNYRNQWERACVKGSLSDMKDRLCEEIKKEKHGNQNQQGKLETMLECAEGVKDIKRCVTKRSCGVLPSVEIFCAGHVNPTSPPQPNKRPDLAPIIVGVALLLLVLILIVLFIRFCVRRARKSKMSSRMLSTKDMEFESGEYEDVMNKENEMEDFSPGRFRSEDEFITENDRHSVSSLPYDDIDEADEARPLTLPGPAAPADRDANMHEDGVTYEVEDPQESYDDIDTVLETTETKVEVHDSPQTTHDTAAPPGLAKGDEDYLEPDQDG